MGKISATIALDAMSGDLGPTEIIRALRWGFKNLSLDCNIVLVGKEELLRRLLKKAKIDQDSRLSIVNASQVINMDEKPIQSIKQKKDSSLVRMVDLVKVGQCNAAVSCGNTGSLMAAGTLKLRPMAGLERPALASVIPSKDHHFVLIDAGANPTPKPEHIVHNAILGSRYCQVALNRDFPRVGLLSNGTEEGKGNELTQESYELLKKVDGIINFNGLVEGLQIFENKVDVIVCDGFTGNILLKGCESLFSMVKGFLKDEIEKKAIRKLGALFCKGALLEVKKQLNPDTYGGAPLLGLRGNILKAHGNSNQYAIMNAIRIASEIVTQDMNAMALADIEKANEIIKSKNKNS